MAAASFSGWCCHYRPEWKAVFSWKLTSVRLQRVMLKAYIFILLGARALFCSPAPKHYAQVSGSILRFWLFFCCFHPWMEKTMLSDGTQAPTFWSYHDDHHDPFPNVPTIVISKTSTRAIWHTSTHQRLQTYSAIPVLMKWCRISLLLLCQCEKWANCHRICWFHQYQSLSQLEDSAAYNLVRTGVQWQRHYGILLWI